MTLSPETLSEYGPMVAAVLVGIVVTRIWSWIFRPKWITVKERELTPSEEREILKSRLIKCMIGLMVFSLLGGCFYTGLYHGWIFAPVPAVVGLGVVGMFGLLFVQIEM